MELSDWSIMVSSKGCLHLSFGSSFVLCTKFSMLHFIVFLDSFKHFNFHQSHKNITVYYHPAGETLRNAATHSDL